MNWLIENKEWVFSGGGIAIISALIFLFKKEKPIASSAIQNHDNNGQQANNNGNNNTQIFQQFGAVMPVENKPTTSENGALDFSQLKSKTRVLFIDDNDFPVVKNLKKAGWITDLINDVYETNFVVKDILIADANVILRDRPRVWVTLGDFSHNGWYLFRICHAHNDVCCHLRAHAKNGICQCFRKHNEIIALQCQIGMKHPCNIYFLPSTRWRDEVEKLGVKVLGKDFFNPFSHNHALFPCEDFDIENFGDLLHSGRVRLFIRINAHHRKVHPRWLKIVIPPNPRSRHANAINTQ